MTVLIVIAIVAGALLAAALVVGLLRAASQADEQQILDEQAANENVRPLGNVERKP